MSTLAEAIEQAAQTFTGALSATDRRRVRDMRRHVHNGLIDKHPAAIACCHGAADVADAVEAGAIDRTSRWPFAAADTTWPAARRSTRGS